MYKNAGGRTSRANKDFEGQRNMVATTPRMVKLPKKANNKIEQSSDVTFKAAAKKNFQGNPGLAVKLAKLRAEPHDDGDPGQGNKSEKKGAVMPVIGRKGRPGGNLSHAWHSKVAKDGTRSQGREAPRTRR